MIILKCDSDDIKSETDANLFRSTDIECVFRSKFRKCQVATGIVSALHFKIAVRMN
jgi:hypothetical protein